MRLGKEGGETQGEAEHDEDAVRNHVEEAAKVFYARALVSGKT